MNAINHFLSNLPAKPYCSNNLENGIYVRPRATAITQKYIQYNNPQWLTSLVFDIDQMAFDRLDEAPLKPNFVVYNRQEPSKGHFFFLLKAPISRTEKSSQKAYGYYEKIRNAMTSKLVADPFFTHFITKTPENQKHITTPIHNNLFELDDLATEYGTQYTKHTPECSHLQAAAHEAAKKTEGRNCAIFDTVRLIAYRTINTYRKNDDYAGFYSFIENTADRENDNFQAPLSSKEVAQIVKSITKWTWKNYHPKTVQNGKIIHRGRDAAINQQLTEQERKAVAAIKTNEQRRKTTQEKINQAVRRLQAQQKKITQKAVKEQSGLHINTIKKHWKSIKK